MKDNPWVVVLHPRLNCVYDVKFPTLGFESLVMEIHREVYKEVIK